MVIVAGLLAGSLLAFGGLFALSRMVMRARGLFWSVLLEKYPPRRDICVAVLLDVLDSFVIANLMVGGRSMGVHECPVILGERGVHLADSAKIRCTVGHEINEDYIFIPWSRLSLEEASCSVEVLGTGDHLVFCSPAAALMAMRPRWKRDMALSVQSRHSFGDIAGPYCPFPWPGMPPEVPPSKGAGLGAPPEAGMVDPFKEIHDHEFLGALRGAQHPVHPHVGEAGGQAFHGGA